MPIPSFLRENRRLVLEIACYLVLAAVAMYLLLPVRTSNDRFVLGFVLCFFTILAVKSISRAAADKDRE